MPEGHADLNPYASPGRDTMAAPLERERPRWRILAVIVGCVVDIVSSSVAGIVLGMVLAVVLIAKGVNPSQIQQMLTTSSAALVGGLLIGTCGSILGGYVAAWMSGHRELQHALATGLLSVALGTAMMGLQSLMPMFPSQPVWLNVTAFGLTVPAAVLGGWLRQRLARRLA